MNSRKIVLMLVMLAAVTAACATGRGTPLYRRDIGTASLMDAVSLANQVLARKAYEVESSDTVPDIRIVTHWKVRQPFPDEAELGITNAESRIIVVGRRRGQTEMGAFYAITLQLENRVRVVSAPEWNEAANTPMFRAYADEIANEYRRLVTNIGVRRY